MIDDLISQKVKSLPRNPGVYMFKDEAGRIIYIGKAAVLKNRVSQYFQHNLRTSQPEKEIMVRLIQNIEYRETDSEIEALILEAHLIKKYRPKYNIALKDSKNYGFIVVTKEDFPRLIVTHQPAYTANPREVIGPFVDLRSLRNTLRTLRRVFPFCTCKKPHQGICLYNRLELCSGFCCVKNKRDSITLEAIKNYKSNIRNVIKFLRGEKKQLVSSLKKQMELAAKNHEFEKASKLRDQIYYLEKVIAHKKVIEEKTPFQNLELLKLVEILRLPHVPIRIEGYDISNIQGTSATGSMVVFENFVSVKNDYRKFRIRGLKTPNDTAMLQEVMRRRLNHSEWPLPDLFLIDGGRGQLNAVMEVLIQRGIRISAVALAKQEEELYSPTLPNPLPLKSFSQPIQYAFQRIRDEAHRFAVTYHRKLRSKKMKI